MLSQKAYRPGWGNFRGNFRALPSPPRFDKPAAGGVKQLMENPSRRVFLAASAGALAARFAFSQAPNDLAALTLKQASEGIRAKKFTPVELTEACLASIKTWNPKINAWITVMREKALAQAKTLTEEQAAGIAWLCSDEAAMVTGQNMPIDGGWTAQY